MRDCPSDDTFAAFIENRLEGARLEAFFQHSRDCQSCTATLAALARCSNEGEPSNAEDPLSQRDPLTPRPEIGGRYVAREILGAGGMGIVYLAQDNRLNRRVALKLTRAGITRANVFRMMREAQAMAQLSHQNVVTVYDVGTWNRHVFIAMEYLEGGTLSRYLLERKPSTDVVLEYFLQAGRGLAAAHSEGIVHRDFKPDNVLLGADGQARVADFGLARWYASDPSLRSQWLEAGSILSLQSLRADPLTRLGSMVGTPAYMAPEQVKGQPVDQRADIWSFSAALYEALYCELPFPGRTPAEVLEYVERGTVRAPPKGSGVPRWLRQALLRGLKAAPEDRYATMAELLDVIEHQTAPMAKRRVVWMVGSLVVISALLGVGLFGPEVKRDGHLRPSTAASRQVPALVSQEAEGTTRVGSELPDPQSLAQRLQSAPAIQVVPVDSAASAPQASKPSAARVGKTWQSASPGREEPAVKADVPQTVGTPRSSGRAKDHLRGF